MKIRPRKQISNPLLFTFTPDNLKKLIKNASLNGIQLTPLVSETLKDNPTEWNGILAETLEFFSIRKKLRNSPDELAQSMLDPDEVTQIALRLDTDPGTFIPSSANLEIARRIIAKIEDYLGQPSQAVPSPH